MARQSEFLAFVLEQMAATGTPRARAMFGGHAIYDGDVLFALVIGDTLYLKTDDETRSAFVQRGLQPFQYTARGRTISLTYFEAPPEVFEQAASMHLWVKRALGAALRTAKARSAADTTKRRRKPVRATAGRKRM